MKLKLLFLPLLTFMLTFSSCEQNQSAHNDEGDSHQNDGDDDKDKEDKGEEEEGGEEQKEKTLLASFYDDIANKNFTVTNSSRKELFCGDYGYSEEIFGMDDFAILQITDEGIFEAHKLASGDYEIHGMLSPNKNIDYNLFSYNFMAILDITKPNWTLMPDKVRYQVFTTSQQVSYNLLNAGMFDNVEDIESVILKAGINGNKYELTVRYYADSMLDEQKITISDVGTTKNEKLEELSKKEPVAQTTWSQYQLDGMEGYGFTDIPFFSTFGLGIKLYFNYFVINGSAVTVFEIYDYLGSKEDEAVIADELENLYGFLPHQHQSDGIYSYYKSYLGDINLLVQFKYVSRNEIEYIEQEAFPYGYTQLSYAYVAAETDLSEDDLNALFTEVNLPTLDLDMDRLARLYKIEYKDIYNQSIMEDEEYIAICEALGLDVGPMYEHYFSLFLEVSDNELDYDYIVSLLDSFISDLKTSGFVIRPECQDYEEESIKDAPNGVLSFDFYKNELPYGGIDIYLFGSYGDFETFNGTVEIVYEEYTELGINVLMSSVE